MIDAAARDAILTGGAVVGVYWHRGSPGGHNNDRVVLTMESGDVIRIDAYAMTGMTVQLRRAGSEEGGGS